MYPDVRTGRRRRILAWLTYAAALLILTWGAGFGAPVEVIPDETAILKNVYAMLEARSLSLPHHSSYSVWMHWFFAAGTGLYWAVQFAWAQVAGGPGAGMDVDSFRLFVAGHWQDAIPFLRVWAGSFFLLSLIAVRRAMEKSTDRTRSWLFFLFVVTNLLVVQNAHHAKQWIPAVGFFLFGFAAYRRGVAGRSPFFRILGLMLCSVGGLTVYTLNAFLLYLPLIRIYCRPERWEWGFSPRRDRIWPGLWMDAVLFAAIFGLMAAATLLLGAGGNARDLVGDPLGFLLPDFREMALFFFSELEYNPVVTVVAGLTVLGMFATHFRLLAVWLAVPYIAYAWFMASFHFETRYCLFMTLHACFIASLGVREVLDRFRPGGMVLGAAAVVWGLSMTLPWLMLVSQTDTRLQAARWLHDWKTADTFVLYNTSGFNYLPMTADGVRALKRYAPEMVGAREGLALREGIRADVAGGILWKAYDNDVDIPGLITALQRDGWQVLLVTERAGRRAFSWRKARRIEKALEAELPLSLLREFLPYEEPDGVRYRETVGDPLQNLTNVFHSLRVLERPGPEVRAYVVGWGG